MATASAMHETYDTAPFTFAVPEHFNEVPLDETPEQRALRQYESLSRTFRGLDPARCLHMVLGQEMALAHMIREGAVYLATCLARSGSNPARAVTAQFSVLVKEAELHSGRSLREIARALKDPAQPREVILNEFPAGEALVVGEEVLVRQPITVLGQNSPQEHRLRQAHVIFILPKRGCTITLTMASQNIDDWEHFVTILNRIAHSVSFTSSERSNILNRLDGLP